MRGSRATTAGVLLCIAALCSAARTVSATTILPMTFDQLLDQAATVVRGEVVDVRSEFRERRDQRTIETIVTFRIHSVIKGASGALLQLEFLGGTVGADTLRVAGQAQFAVGDHDFLFIEGDRQSVSPIVGLGLGRFPIRRDAFTGRMFVTTYEGQPFVGVLEFGRTVRAAAGTKFPAANAGAASSVGFSDAAFERLVVERIRDRQVRH
jgi:hypothetical protein